MEDGIVTVPEEGSPQGCVISPLLSNIYLHEVLDKWFAQTVRPRVRGESAMVRFADDAILVLSNKDDAERVLKAVGKRVARFGLELHPEKTRLVRFQPMQNDEREGEQEGTFNFLGFTHYWGKSRKGRWVVKRKTAKDRLRRALKEIKKWCRGNRHRKIKEQHRVLSAKLQGHYNYYGITGNFAMVAKFYDELTKTWWRWLRRRSQRRHLSMTAFFRKLGANPLPRPHLPRSIYLNLSEPSGLRSRMS